MKLNYFTEQLSTLGRWIATTLSYVLAITFFWQGAFFFNTAAMANPATNLIAKAEIGDQLQEKTSEEAGRAKNFIRNTADRVEQTAKSNASRVEQATDEDGSFVQGKAKRDAARIEQRAEGDAARTQKAVDNTKNVVERTVDSIKDAFN